MSTTVQLPVTVAATPITATATLAKGKHTKVDVSGGAFTVNLPTGAAAGVVIVVEKADSSANTVTIAGTINGTGASTRTLIGQNETKVFVSEGSDSWRLHSDHRPLAMLDARYGAAPALSTKTANYTILATDSVVLFNGATLTATLPSAVAVGASGKTYTVKNLNASALTLASTAGNIDGATTITVLTNEAYTVVSDGTNWKVI